MLPCSKTAITVGRVHTAATEPLSSSTTQARFNSKCFQCFTVDCCQCQILKISGIILLKIIKGALSKNFFLIVYFNYQQYMKI